MVFTVTTAAFAAMPPGAAEAGTVTITQMSHKTAVGAQWAARRVRHAGAVCSRISPWGWGVISIGELIGPAVSCVYAVSPARGGQLRSFAVQIMADGRRRGCSRCGGSALVLNFDGSLYQATMTCAHCMAVFQHEHWQPGPAPTRFRELCYAVGSAGRRASRGHSGRCEATPPSGPGEIPQRR
jgi:hypothetical protein